MPADPVSRPWRSYLRFSVHGLIVVVLLIGGSLGWIARSAQTQRDAVGAIKRAGGSVRYDSEWTDNLTLETREPWPPNWLVNAIGIDY